MYPAWAGPMKPLDGFVHRSPPRAWVLTSSIDSRVEEHRPTVAHRGRMKGECFVKAGKLKQIAQICEQQRAETLSVIRRLEHDTRAAGEDDPKDIGDHSVSNFSKEFLFQELTRNRSRLRKLETALERMREGSFGQCANCGSDIGIKRLEAMPWTEYCRNCQEELERVQAGDAGKIS